MRWIMRALKPSLYFTRDQPLAPVVNSLWKVAPPMGGACPPGRHSGCALPTLRVGRGPAAFVEDQAATTLTRGEAENEGDW